MKKTIMGTIDRINVNHVKNVVTIRFTEDDTVYLLEFDSDLGRSDNQAIDLSQSGDWVQIDFYSRPPTRLSDGDIISWYNTTLFMKAESPGDML